MTGNKALEHRTKIENQANLAATKLGCSIDQLGQQTVELVTAIRKLKKLLSSAGGGEAAPAKFGGSTAAKGARPSYVDVRGALKQAARALNVSPEEVAGRIDALLAEENQLHQQLSNLSSAGGLNVDELLGSAEMVGSSLLVTAKIPNANSAMLRQWIDQIRKKSSKPVAVLFATSEQDKVSMIAALSQSLVDSGLDAKVWISPVAEVVGGKGGGRPDLAQAGGKLPDKIDEAIALARSQWRSIAGK